LTTDSVAQRMKSATWSRPLGKTNALEPAHAEPASHPSFGRFTLLTYNVAGLPQLVSPSEPAVNVPLISPLLNLYDVALVQEDFSYHADLERNANHSYRTESMRQSLALMPDGLNQFSRFPIAWTHRVRWNQCNGYFDHASDCLADKGFSFTRMTLAPGVRVDVYNLHADAGSKTGDVRARRANFEQLAEYVQQYSSGNAVLVAGDTNLRVSSREDASTLQQLLSAISLSDACHRFGCGEERLDRVFFRSSPTLELDVLGWWTDTRFVDAEGTPLSDHAAIGVEVRWRQLEAPRSLVAERHR
jgi:endonuclease/exonuclease/phosphatase family metal-dependent hydrolase